jgi:hypothetical protein
MDINRFKQKSDDLDVPLPRPSAFTRPITEVVEPPVTVQPAQIHRPSTYMSRGTKTSSQSLSQQAESQSSLPSAGSGALAAEPQIVSIQISFPKLKLPDVGRYSKQLIRLVLKMEAYARQRLVSVPRVWYRRLALVAATLAVLMLVGGVGLKVKSFVANRDATAAASAVNAAAAKAKTTAARATPNFTPLAPENPASGGTSQTRYDGTHNVYSFSDTLNNTAIIVSQQPIPANFNSAAAAVTKVAASLDATEPVPISSGTAMVATDTKANSQTVVFTKDNLLVFIQSPFTHSSAEWEAYINGLKAQ